MEEQHKNKLMRRHEMGLLQGYDKEEDKLLYGRYTEEDFNMMKMEALRDISQTYNRDQQSEITLCVNRVVNVKVEVEQDDNVSNHENPMREHLCNSSTQEIEGYTQYDLHPQNSNIIIDVNEEQGQERQVKKKEAQQLQEQSSQVWIPCMYTDIDYTSYTETDEQGHEDRSTV
ncbi:MAG: hypothetical protein EZS28_050235 [Streblomastix strix]|uniref:Uncharacterized protein n=1 Tax=Streblomastix strix TaxID=222440 RepID=A0A5J4T7Q5_9EUKA|nr:MAG: hypothetical protein EZS28_050235 [Streblomastix strix]